MFDPSSRVVHNFNLELIDTTGGGNAVVASSQSTIDNTETLAIAVLAGRSYSLKVSNTHGSNVNRDYALGWRLESDRDRDGLFDKFEAGSCPGVSDADSDDDGLSDGAEDVNLDGVINATETNPCVTDTDGDGVQDGTERSITTPVADPDGAGPLLGTDPGSFVPDADPATTTSATIADTDGDGANDGAEDLNHNGAFEPGESDPNNAGSVPTAVQTVPTFATGRAERARSTVLVWPAANRPARDAVPYASESFSSSQISRATCSVIRTRYFPPTLSRKVNRNVPSLSRRMLEMASKVSVLAMDLVCDIRVSPALGLAPNIAAYFCI